MSKVLVLKLGGRCNLHCPHCHAEQMDYQFNSLILDYIRETGYQRITFSGGEPLLYFPLIKQITEALGHNYQYKFMTNATLLTDAMVDFLNEYDFTVGYSFDGYDSARDIGKPNLEALSRIKHNTMSVTCYHHNIDLFKLKADIDKFIEKHNLTPRPSLYANFVHQTATSDTDDTTFEDAQSYCKQLALMIEPELLRIKSGKVRPEEARHYCSTAYMALYNWWLPKKYKGLKCFNTNVHCMTISGQFLVCPYTTKYPIGNFLTGIDWQALDKLIPEKCKQCSLFNICHGSCMANISGNECYIARTMNRWLNKVIVRHQLLPILDQLFDKKNNPKYNKDE